MGTHRIWLFSSAALIVETAACGALLGDFPDGQLNGGADGSIESGSLDAGPDTNPALANGPPSAICIAQHAEIIDFAVDGPWIYWLQVTSDDQSTFSLVQCAMATGVATPMGPPLPARPEAIALSDQFIFWTINQKADAANPGGVWRVAKTGQDTPNRWRPYNQAGPITFAGNRLFVATHDGNIYNTSPTATNDDQSIASGQSDPTSIAASGTDVYWSATKASQIMMAPSSGVGITLTFWGNFGTLPSLLAAGTRGLFWNNSVRAGGYAIFYQACPQSGGCSAKAIYPTKVDPGGIVAEGGDFFWTSNEGQNGIVRRCLNAENVTECPSDDSKYVELNAELSHIAADKTYLYFAAKYGGDSYIVRIAR